MSNGMVTNPSRQLARNPYRVGFDWTRFGLQAAKHIYNNGRFGNGRSAFANASQAVRGARTFVNNPSPGRSPRAMVKRMRTTKSAPKRLTYSTGGSGGSMYKKKKTRRVSKYKKKKRGKRSKGKANFITGIQSRIEATQNVADLEAVYVGHTTCATTTIHDKVCMAISKALLMKEGFSIPTVNDQVRVNVASTLTLVYYNSPTSVIESVYSVNIIVYPTLVQFNTALKSLISQAINGYDKQQQFVRLRWLSDDAAVGTYRFTHEFNLSSIVIDGFMKSTMSMQNSTPNATGGSDGKLIDVNNANPVRCIPYYGKGNGTFWLNRTAANAGYESFLGDQSTGSITVLAKEASGKVLDEPPLGKFFLHAKRAKGFVLQPGEIKVQQLYSPIHMNLRKYIEYYEGYDEDDNNRQKMGKFQFFGIEKVLSTNLPSGLASDVKISIDYEIDYATAFKVSLKKSLQPTAPVNTSIAYPNKA